YIAVQLPDAASLERSQKVVDEINDILQGVPDPVLAELEDLKDREYPSRAAITKAINDVIDGVDVPNNAERQRIRNRGLTVATRDGKPYMLTDQSFGYLRHIKGIVYITGIGGQSFTLNANGSNFAQFFVAFDEFQNRRDPSLSSTAICDTVRARLENEVPEAKV